MSDEEKTALEKFEAKYDEIIEPARPGLRDTSEEEPDDDEEVIDPREPAPKDDGQKVDADQEEQTDGEETEGAFEAEAKEDEYEDIPSEQVAAARALGMEDDAIINLPPKVLEALAAKVENSQKQPPAKQVQPVEVLQKLEKAGENKLAPFVIDENDDPEESLKKLTEHVNKTIKNLGSGISNITGELGVSKKQAAQQFDYMVDGFFDGVKDLPQIGKTDSLTPTQEVARKEVFNIARSLDGVSWDVRLGKAVKAFQGIYGSQKSGEDSLRRKLQTQKTKFSPRPSGKKGSSKGAPKSEEERAMKAINDVLDAKA